MARIDGRIMVNVPVLGANVPRRGNRLTRALGRGVLALLGWRFEGAVPNVTKVIAIAAPHTSAWDFVIGMAAILAAGADISWFGKHTFVNGPFGFILRRFGGIPVDRRAAHGLVQQAVTEFERRQSFLLALAPEGTRGKVVRWKSGFYHIAQGARVPILPVMLDYGRKVLQIGSPLRPSGNLEADMADILSFYASAVGRNPHLQ